VALALWRDIALVWLALLCFIGLIIPLAISLLAVKGMHAAVDRTPGLLRQVQGYSRGLRGQVESAGVRVAAPVIRTHKEASRMSTIAERLFKRAPERGESKK
jgi:hypothetical protein